LKVLQFFVRPFLFFNISKSNPFLKILVDYLIILVYVN